MKNINKYPRFFIEHMSSYHKILIVVSALLLFIATAYSQTNEDSPFGFCPAAVFLEGYQNSGFSDAQNIGVTWTRPSIFAFWALVQPDMNDSTLIFNRYDQMFGTVPAGINILANISAAPANGDFSEHLMQDSYRPTDSTKYIRFVKRLVDRYNGDGVNDMPGLVNPIKYWQVGNEPNDRKTGFADLQRITYTAVKDVDTTVSIVIGGVSGFPPQYISFFNKTYEPLLQELGGKYFDIFDFHWYGNASGEYRLKDTKTGQDVLEHIKATIKKYGYSEDMPFWITEMGAYSGSPGPLFALTFPSQTEAQQASDYIKRYVYPLARGVKKIFPAYGLIEGFKQDDGYYDHTGLIYDGKLSDDLGIGVKKLGYYTYKLMTEKLEGSDWNQVETIIDGTDDTYCYGFKKKDGKIIRVLWWDYFDDPGYTNGKTTDVNLTIPNIDSVLITSAVPNADNGSELNENDYPAMFKTEIKKVVGNMVNITLGENPVFIEKLSSSSVGVGETNHSKKEIRILHQNYPNPFTSYTVFSFDLNSDNRISLKIFDVSGNEITTLIKDRFYQAGGYEVKWDALSMPSGIYYYQITSNSFSEIGTARLIR
ncbi:MAG: T9SS type A sorting domain-containing protein [Fibrobacteria bacterium]|nr:T9SS type A sorting domain-containing protein [Fibrobacteria bacterium]